VRSGTTHRVANRNIEAKIKFIFQLVVERPALAFPRCPCFVASIITHNTHRHMRAGNTATASETRQPHRVVAPALTCTRRTYLIVNQSLSCSLLDLTYLISDCSSCLQRFFQASPSRGPARIVSNGMPESDFLSPESISIMKQRSQQWLSPRTAREIRTKKLFWYTMQKKDRPTALMRESVGGAGVTYLIHLAHHILFMAGH